MCVVLRDTHFGQQQIRLISKQSLSEEAREREDTC